MDNIFEGKRVEVRMKNGHWTECPEECEYRVKPEFVHKFMRNKTCNTLCENWNYGDNMNSETGEDVTCPDCLEKMKAPEWVKIGAKCFANFGGLEELCEIVDINGNWIKIAGSKHEGSFPTDSITPAKRQVSYEYLAKKMPFAVKEKSSCKITAVLSVSAAADEVWIAGKGYTSFSLKEFGEYYLLPDGSELGEWVKA